MVREYLHPLYLKIFLFFTKKCSYTILDTAYFKHSIFQNINEIPINLKENVSLVSKKINQF